MAIPRPNIWQFQSRRNIQGLITALEYPDPEIRRRAADALRTLDATQAVPAVKAALQNEADPRTRAHLSTTLHVLSHRTDIESLIKAGDVQNLIQALKSRHPKNVVAAAQALGRLGDRIAVEPLIMLFNNGSAPPQVRLAAAEALLELKSAPAVITLIGALKRDSWQVRRNAAAVLGQLQASWAVAPLAKALDDPNSVVRRTAAAALRRIGTPEAVAVLRDHFAQQPPKARPEPAAPHSPPTARGKPTAGRITSAAPPPSPMIAETKPIGLQDTPVVPAKTSPLLEKERAPSTQPVPVSGDTLHPASEERKALRPSPPEPTITPARRRATMPAVEPQFSERDTKPVPRVPPKPPSLPEEDAHPTLHRESPGKINRPVLKLIGYFRRRSEDDNS
ncbi:MAG: HEAT repeat domain-containing protein [Anaerolineae bacterium]|nr:HEAT repeat domain-containing protein [Anaerolineae bacterium]